MIISELVIEGHVVVSREEKLRLAIRLIRENALLVQRNRFTCDECGHKEDHPSQFLKILEADAEGKTSIQIHTEDGQ